ncbi:MAG TPA: ATP-dependent DNA ligase, partial [Erythrobacter sp.]|nr:ATP-dependent DNA ligase [Erythrobacter sp.]
PDIYVAEASKAKRKGRIFIDWLRNQRGATAVVPYSARARSGAPVAITLAWNELKAMENAHPYSIDDAKTLLDRAASKSLQGWGFAEQRLPDL